MYGVFLYFNLLKHNIIESSIFSRDELCCFKIIVLYDKIRLDYIYLVFCIVYNKFLSLRDIFVSGEQFIIFWQILHY